MRRYSRRTRELFVRSEKERRPCKCERRAENSTRYTNAVTDTRYLTGSERRSGRRRKKETGHILIINY